MISDSSDDNRELASFERNHLPCFHNKALLQRAFIHRSYLNELGEGCPDLADNERLEFLGDSVLGFVVSEHLFRRYPDKQEGELTNLRAALVRRETLADFARRLRLGEYLMLGHGEEESGGRTRPATLCATFEAVVGAIYLDQGTESVRTFVEPLLLREIEAIEQQAFEKDPKSRLQEWVQSEMGQTPRYQTVASEGPDHAKHFTVQVTIRKQAYGVGQGRTKQEAAQEAAAMALHRFGQPAPEYDPGQGLESQWPLATP